MRRRNQIVLYGLIFTGLLLPGRTQTRPERGGVQAQAADAELLPDEPGVALQGTGAQSAAVALQPVAAKYAHTILPGQQAQRLTAGDKLVYATRDRLSVGAFADALWRAGWEQVTNEEPHYGTDSGAFGERLAAAEFRETASHVLTNGVFAAMLHDDPRYYRMGRSHSIKQRVVYAGTRVIFTRKDDGERAVNVPRLAATATVSGLNNLYYPREDRGWGSSAENAATSLGLKAVGYEFSEFMGDLLHAVHLKKAAE